MADKISVARDMIARGTDALVEEHKCEVVRLCRKIGNARGNAASAAAWEAMYASEKRVANDAKSITRSHPPTPCKRTY